LQFFNIFSFLFQSDCSDEGWLETVPMPLRTTGVRGGNGRQDFKVIKTTLIILVLAAGLVNAACLTRADLQIGIMSSGLGYDGGQRAIHLAAKGY
jgi:hypothetical protein